jgi:hypothetical protein
MRWWVGALVLVLVIPHPARAGCGGCPNLCSGVTLGSVSATPALPSCVTLTPSSDGTCDCGVFLAFSSTCASPASINSCPGATSAAVTDGATGCHAVEAPQSVVLRATGNGQQQWLVLVDANGVTSTVTVDATVTGLGSDSACSVTTTASGRRLAAGLILAAVAVLGARRRTRRAPR